jgi:hypothetical protein
VYALEVNKDLLTKLAHLADQQKTNNVVPIHGHARDIPAVLPEAVDTLVGANNFHDSGDEAGIRLLEFSYRVVRIS